MAEKKNVCVIGPAAGPKASDASKWMEKLEPSSCITPTPADQFPIDTAGGYTVDTLDPAHDPRQKIRVNAVRQFLFSLQGKSGDWHPVFLADISYECTGAGATSS